MSGCNSSVSGAQSCQRVRVPCLPQPLLATLPPSFFHAGLPDCAAGTRWDWYRRASLESRPASPSAGFTPQSLWGSALWASVARLGSEGVEDGTSLEQGHGEEAH